MMQFSDYTSINPPLHNATVYYASRIYDLGPPLSLLTSVVIVALLYGSERLFYE